MFSKQFTKDARQHIYEGNHLSATFTECAQDCDFQGNYIHVRVWDKP